VDALRNQFAGPSKEMINTILVAQTQVNDGFLAWGRSFGCGGISGIFERDNMNFLRALMMVAVVILSGCAHSTENSCKQECMSEYIECTKGGPDGLRAYSSQGCREIYESCISTCSSK
jgi:hypothetical protein